VIITIFVVSSYGDPMVILWWSYGPGLIWGRKSLCLGPQKYGAKVQ